MERVMVPALTTVDPAHSVGTLGGKVPPAQTPVTCPMITDHLALCFHTGSIDIIRALTDVLMPAVRAT